VAEVRRSGELHDADLASLLRLAEDPRGLLGYTTGQRQELLAGLRLAISDIAARCEHAQLRERRLRKSADRLLEQAWQAVTAGRSDQARQVRAWHATIWQHAAELRAEQAVLHASQERLSAIARRLQDQPEVHRIGWEPRNGTERAATLK
jgi:phage shock protein A